MADNVTKKKRSQIMSAIRSKDSKLELLLRKELSHLGLRYRKNVSRLPGKPDIAFIGKKIVIFLDSCFWHGCKNHCRIPTDNRVYWLNKISVNKKRDKEVNRIYRNKGWRVLRFWEHDFNKNPKKILVKIKNIVDKARSGSLL